MSALSQPRLPPRPIECPRCGGWAVLDCQVLPTLEGTFVRLTIECRECHDKGFGPWIGAPAGSSQ